MTADDYRQAIDALGLNQTSAARFLGVTPRSSRYYASGRKIPRSVSGLLTLMVKYEMTPDQLLELIGEKR